MKKHILTAGILFITLICSKSTSASNYAVTMQQNMDKMYQVTTADELRVISGNFYRLSQEQAEEWLPLYYASYARVRVAFYSKDRKEIDKSLDVAQAYLDKLYKLKPDESEVYVVQALLYSMRITGMVSGMKYSVLSNEALDKAQEFNKENPRIYYIRGNNVMNTPVMVGGGKSKAKPIFEEACRRFDMYKVTTPFWPTWDKKHAAELLEQCK